MEKNSQLDSSAAATKVEESLGLPESVDILTFDVFKEAATANVDSIEVLTVTAKVQDTIIQGGNLIAGASEKNLREGAEALFGALVDQLVVSEKLDLDDKNVLEDVIVQASDESGAELTKLQIEVGAAIIEVSNTAKEEAKEVAKNSAKTALEVATEVARVQAVSQSEVSNDLEAVGARTVDLNLINIRFIVTIHLININ